MPYKIVLWQVLVWWQQLGPKSLWSIVSCCPDPFWVAAALALMAMCWCCCPVCFNYECSHWWGDHVTARYQWVPACHSICPGQGCEEAPPRNNIDSMLQLCDQEQPEEVHLGTQLCLRRLAFASTSPANSGAFSWADGPSRYRMPKSWSTTKAGRLSEWPKQWNMYYCSKAERCCDSSRS